MAGQVGKDDEYYRYKSAILDKVGETYPYLKAECKRQDEQMKRDREMFERYNSCRF